MEKKNIITLKNDAGEEIDCRVLFTVEDEKTKKNYIVYTDDEKEKDGRVKTYASIYEQNKDNEILKLIPIKTQKEWDFISKILSSLEEKGI